MLTTAFVAGLALATPAASQDNSVEWSGISHVSHLDRRPRCPIDGESFYVYLHTFENDATSVRVRFDDGQPRWIDADRRFDRGAHDVWIAALPCSSPTGSVEYFFEITDGSDTDFFSPSGMGNFQPSSGWVVDFGSLSHAPLGATPATDGVVFRVWGEGATTAAVAGTFNAWSTTANPMTKQGEYFVTHVPNTQIGHEYRFIFNGSYSKPDARAGRLNALSGQNSLIVSPYSYTWASSLDFTPPPFEEMIIYQVHVGTFSGKHDGNNFGYDPATYRSVVDSHLQHIVDLGVNVVQLMPITEWPGDWSGGYNPISQWAPEWVHGPPDDVKYMIDKFHEAGIAVTVDIVWNHFASNDNYLWEYTNTGSSGQIYFDGFDTMWGPQADLDKPEVQDYFADSALHWLHEYRFDGFRMDATDFMSPPHGQSGGWGLMQRMNDEINRRFVDKISYAEQLPDDYYLTRSIPGGGAGFDAQYHDEYKWAMRGAIIDAAYNSANISRLTEAIRGKLNDGNYILSVGQKMDRLVRYFELHDEAWKLNGNERMVKTIDTTFPHDDIYARSRTLFGHAVTMFSPGIPAFFMGAEFLESTDFETDSAYRLDWSKVNTYSDYLQAFQDMIWLKRDNPALKANSPFTVSHVNDSIDVFAMSRTDGVDNDLMIVASLSNSDWGSYNIGFPEGGTWHRIFNTQDAAYGGTGLATPATVVPNGPALHGFSQSATLVIPRMSVLVYRKEACQSDPQCDDGIACTLDACLNGACVNEPDPAACPDDGLFCNGLEICDATAGCISTGDPCGDETCDEVTDTCSFITDVDGDGLDDACDNCPFVPNQQQVDTDLDMLGDLCDDDDDADGIPDTSDNCPLVANHAQTDTDSDGVGDACDLCPGTPPGILVDPEGCTLPIPGDFDLDRDVDLLDFSVLQKCLSANGQAAVTPVCQAADLDGDIWNDVDQDDLNLFLLCMQGPNVEVQADCAD